MATYKILYWQEIPSQIMERIDQLAAQRGLQGTDDYLAQWRWSDGQERDGSAEDVARAIKSELEAEAGC